MSSIKSSGGRVVKGLSEINGPIVVVEGALDAGYDDVVIVEGDDGEERRGRVLEAGEGFAVIQ
ncbi:MAG: V-type ATP synthase subunit B, partial [Anaerolineae bacterium]|nr:V-type ATP synthase subunit B [Anaerolineae bacterium]